MKRSFGAMLKRTAAAIIATALLLGTGEGAVTAKAAGAPEQGKSYNLDFAKLSGVSRLNGYTSEDGVFKVVSEADKAYYHDGQHGAALYNGDRIEVKVAGSAVIELSLCQYGSGVSFDVTDAEGVKVGALAGKVTTDGQTDALAYDGPATTLALTLVSKGEAYLHSIHVENLAASGSAENFTVWLDDLAADGVVEAKAYKYGDSTLTLCGEGETQYTVQGSGVTEDGIFRNTYKAGKRHADSNNINTLPTGQGEGTLTLFAPAAKGMFTVYFNSTSFLRVHDFNADGTKNGFTDTATGISSYSFVAYPGHVYVLSTTGKTNNMFYAGYSYVRDEKITNAVAVTNVDATVGETLKIEIRDAKLGGDAIIADVETVSLELLKGHTYSVKTNDGGVNALVDGKDTFTVDGSDITVTLNNVPDEGLLGCITGTPEETVTRLYFTNMANGTVAEAQIVKDTFACLLKPGEYKATVETTNGGVTFDRVSVVKGADNYDEVFVEVPDSASARSYVYNTIENLPTTGSVAVETGKTHCVAKAGATITVPVEGEALITVKGYYQADFTVNGDNKTITSKSTSKIDTFEFYVKGDTVFTFNATSYLTGISVTPVTKFKKTISVPGDYATLNEASTAILGMKDRPSGEAGRVTINLLADCFEQVVMAAPYVTLNGNGHEISWYYGVGTLYYSIDPATGLYSERLARDRYSYAEGDGQLWGGTFIVRGNNFIAHDVTFKNTYNYYLTDAEKEDIAGTMLAVDRLADNADVAEYAYKERSNAFYVEADNIECYNCKILSSQDTLGRNGTTNYNFHVYFNNCVIGGNVDYICGEFSAIFDNCELRWKTYVNDAKGNNAKIGYIVAPKTSPYVFRNCKITTDGNEGSGQVLGYFGRTWGDNSCAAFLNTETNGTINEAGWGEMSTGQGKTAIFKEYNNTSNGTFFKSSGTSAVNQSAESVADFIDTESNKAYDTVLAGWKPVSYGNTDKAVKTGDSMKKEGSILALFGAGVLALAAAIFVKTRK